MRLHPEEERDTNQSTTSQFRSVQVSSRRLSMRLHPEKRNTNQSVTDEQGRPVDRLHPEKERDTNQSMTGQFRSVQVSSVQDGIYALQLTVR